MQRSINGGDCEDREAAAQPLANRLEDISLPDNAIKRHKTPTMAAAPSSYSSAHVAAYRIIPKHGKLKIQFLVLLNREGKLMCPGGMKKAGKTPRETMLEEFQEETGMHTGGRAELTGITHLGQGDNGAVLYSAALGFFTSKQPATDKINSYVTKAKDYAETLGGSREVFGWGWATVKDPTAKRLEFSVDIKHKAPGARDIGTFRGGTERLMAAAVRDLRTRKGGIKKTTEAAMRPNDRCCCAP